MLLRAIIKQINQYHVLELQRPIPEFIFHDQQEKLKFRPQVFEHLDVDAPKKFILIIGDDHE